MMAIKNSIEYWYEVTEEQIHLTIWKFPLHVAIVKAKEGLKSLDKSSNSNFKQGAERALKDLIIRHVGEL